MNNISNCMSLGEVEKYLENIHKIKMTFNFVDSSNNEICKITNSYIKHDIINKLYGFIIGNVSVINLKDFSSGVTVIDKHCIFNNILKEFMTKNESYLIISKIEKTKLIYFDETYKQTGIEFSDIPCFIEQEKISGNILKIVFNVKLAMQYKEICGKLQFSTII